MNNHASPCQCANSNSRNLFLKSGPSFIDLHLVAAPDTLIQMEDYVLPLLVSLSHATFAVLAPPVV
jgi:hypothetical protein